jgi:dihydroorotate dehydrogenase electron transfer subunit
MSTGIGTIVEVYFEKNAVARISCPIGLIPGPGQYILAEDPVGIAEILPASVFPSGSAEGGFLMASPLPKAWTPGTSLNLRGPLGNGFRLPTASRAVALAAFGESAQRLSALIEPAIAQGAAVTLLCAQPPQGLPNEVEIMPLGSLKDVTQWADYLALDLTREMIRSLPELFQSITISCEAQVLVATPMPCGGRGDCGVCAGTVKRGYKIICKDGPVLDLKLFL